MGEVSQLLILTVHTISQSIVDNQHISQNCDPETSKLTYHHSTRFFDFFVQGHCFWPLHVLREAKRNGNRSNRNLDMHGPDYKSSKVYVNLLVL